MFMLDTTEEESLQKIRDRYEQRKLEKSPKAKR